jgi:hypothetical protein
MVIFVLCQFFALTSCNTIRNLSRLGNVGRPSSLHMEPAPWTQIYKDGKTNKYECNCKEKCHKKW